ncbi:MAG: hypothetical protein LN416_02020 [Candidatus Thermoplasmatota archaeon]|nr:hypothetical protein [Candidatus Thermoplasmatota archaeon]
MQRIAKPQTSVEPSERVREKEDDREDLGECREDGGVNDEYHKQSEERHYRS